MGKDHNPIIKAVFFYGLFMDELLLKDKGLNPSKAFMASVHGYNLKIGERATIVPDNHKIVYGMVMQLTKKELECLYNDNGVRDYLPVEMTALKADGNSVAVISYILPIEKISGKNNNYAQKLCELVSKLDFPRSYIDEINKWQ